MSEKQIMDLIEAMKNMSMIHYQAYMDYMRITDGDEELSRKLSSDMIKALFRQGGAEE